MFLFISIGLIIVIPLAIFGIKVLFWALAFADFAILMGLSIFFTHFQWGWHTMFVILGTFAIMVAYYGVLRLPIVQYILPIAALGFNSWILVSLINELRIESFDPVWTVTLIIVSSVALISARFYAVSELDLI